VLYARVVSPQSFLKLADTILAAKADGRNLARHMACLSYHESLVQDTEAFIVVLGEATNLRVLHTVTTALALPSLVVVNQRHTNLQDLSLCLRAISCNAAFACVRTMVQLHRLSLACLENIEVTPIAQRAWALPSLQILQRQFQQVPVQSLAHVLAQSAFPSLQSADLAVIFPLTTTTSAATIGEDLARFFARHHVRRVALDFGSDMDASTKAVLPSLRTPQLGLRQLWPQAILCLPRGVARLDIQRIVAADEWASVQLLLERWATFRELTFRD
jgi:hypothetical protein